ncbi:MAG: hypothetical protein Q9181_001019 [Wetmoreana brouardii]
MSLLGRIFADDEELGKKDDDRKPRKINIRQPAWTARKPVAWRRRRTVLYGLIACIALYLFFKNIPPPDHPPMIRPHYEHPPHDALRTPQKSKPDPKAPVQKPPRPTKPSEAENHYFDGPIRFNHLAVSLHAISRLRGHIEANKNVLFAASNLRSAAELIPIACEMARWGKNDVHFALMGRDDLELEEIKLFNGVDDGCNVNWHDARPDFSPWSSDFRMEVSVSAGLGHIQTFMHPQAVITDDPSREDAFFTKGIRGKSLELGRSLIELPTNAAENLIWIARLDSASLSAWPTAYVDILIHAPPYSSGSLLRLLKSIEAADYFGHRRPHLTIELPPEIDPPIADYLEEFVWPPVDHSGATHVSQVTLRRRIQGRTSTVDEASVRLVESFYPARPSDSHVLVLSPQTELSPLYFHFLMYNLLDNRYSLSTRHSEEVKILMGLSLELPYLHLNDSYTFTPPMISRDSKDAEQPPEEPTPFLWQAPNSNAALYFGDKWVEFHSFLTSRISLDPAKAPSRPKLISEIYPSWLEYLLELMRARGYILLYPNFSAGRESIASVHYELFHPPEEFSKPKKTSAAETPLPTLDPKKEIFETDPSTHRPKHPESSPLTSNLNSLLPESGTSQDLFKLPILSYEGHELDISILEKNAQVYTTNFRREISQCPATNRQPEAKSMNADDLFCDRDEERSGLGLGGLALPGPPPELPKPVPEIKDDSDMRQSEFLAHLNRQAGKPPKVEDEEGKGNTKEGSKEDQNGASKDDGVRKKDGEDESKIDGKKEKKAKEQVEAKRASGNDEAKGTREKKIKEDKEDGTGDTEHEPKRKEEKKDDKTGGDGVEKEALKTPEVEKPLGRDRGW